MNGLAVWTHCGDDFPCAVTCCLPHDFATLFAHTGNIQSWKPRKSRRLVEIAVTLVDTAARPCRLLCRRGKTVNLHTMTAIVSNFVQGKCRIVHKACDQDPKKVVAIVQRNASKQPASVAKANNHLPAASARRRRNPSTTEYLCAAVDANSSLVHSSSGQR